MIIEALLNVFKFAFNLIFAILPNLSVIALPSGFMDWFVSIMSMTAYFLPLVDMLVMFGIWMAVTNFHIIWKGIQRIWDSLPFT